MTFSDGSGTNNVNFTLYADVSEFQNPVDDSYTAAGYRVICIRADDGTYQDHHFVQNYQWCVNAANAGNLDFFIVYYYWRPQGTGPGTIMDMVDSQGGPHPKMCVMMDVESGGNGSWDRSGELNAEFARLSQWIGSPQRVIAYGNTYDLNSIWPNKPSGLKLVIAGYGCNPSYPGKIAHQYTDGVVWAGGLPMGAPPFGNCDFNSADGLSSTAFASVCGVGGPVLTPTPPSPPPASPAPTTTTTYTVAPGDTLDLIALRFNVSLTALEQANPGITNPNVIEVGEVIVIPVTTPVTTSPNILAAAQTDILQQFGQ